MLPRLAKFGETRQTRGAQNPAPQICASGLPAAGLRVAIPDEYGCRFVRQTRFVSAFHDGATLGPKFGSFSANAQIESTANFSLAIPRRLTTIPVIQLQRPRECALGSLFRAESETAFSVRKNVTLALKECLTERPAGPSEALSGSVLQHPRFCSHRN